jgi:hypothetical protein
MSYGFITTSRAVAPEISGCYFRCTAGAVAPGAAPRGPARRGAIAPGAAHRGAVARRVPRVGHWRRGTGGRAPWRRGAGRRAPGAVVREQWQSDRLCIRMIVDSLTVQEVLCGHSVLKDRSLHLLFCRVNDRIARWRSLGRKAPTPATDPWTWRPREFNKDPDAAVNQVLDNKSSFAEMRTNWQEYLTKGANLYISSDGGCRGNGVSATGWTVSSVGVGSDGLEWVVWLGTGGTLWHQNCSSFLIESMAVDEVTRIIDAVIN